MKMSFCLVLLAMLTGCASGPTRIMVRNCKALGSDLYQCEEIPQKEVQGRR